MAKSQQFINAIIIGCVKVKQAAMFEGDSLCVGDDQPGDIYLANCVHHHIVNRVDRFETYRVFKKPVQLEGLVVYNALGVGSVRVRAEFRGATRRILLTEVYHVPDSPKNFISQPLLEDKGAQPVITSDDTYIYLNWTCAKGIPLFTCKRKKRTSECYRIEINFIGGEPEDTPSDSSGSTEQVDEPKAESPKPTVREQEGEPNDQAPPSEDKLLKVSASRYQEDELDDLKPPFTIQRSTDSFNEKELEAVAHKRSEQLPDDQANIKPASESEQIIPFEVIQTEPEIGEPLDVQFKPPNPKTDSDVTDEKRRDPATASDRTDDKPLVKQPGADDLNKSYDPRPAETQADEWSSADRTHRVLVHPQAFVTCQIEATRCIPLFSSREILLNSNWKT